MTLTRSQQMRKASFIALNHAVLQAFLGVMFLSQGDYIGLLPAILSAFTFNDFQNFRKIASDMKKEEFSDKEAA